MEVNGQLVRPGRFSPVYPLYKRLGGHSEFVLYSPNLSHIFLAIKTFNYVLPAHRANAAKQGEFSGPCSHTLHEALTHPMEYAACIRCSTEIILEHTAVLSTCQPLHCQEVTYVMDV
jgi:hypothetical protein